MALRSVATDSEAGEMELAWETADSLARRASRRIFGAPPTKLEVPRESFPAVAGHLAPFVD